MDYVRIPTPDVCGWVCRRNVANFRNYPDIKWYFMLTVPFMLCVLGLW